MSGLDLSGEHDDDELGGGGGGEPEEGKDDAKPKRRRSRARKSSSSPRPPRRAATEADLRKRIEDGLSEVIAFVEDRLEWDDVARAMREDHKRMAEVLAARATKHARLGAALTRIFGRDSALSFARAFGPTLRVAAARFGTWRETHQAEQPWPIVDAEGWVLNPDTGERTGERVAVG